jgi:hypothetical protein
MIRDTYFQRHGEILKELGTAQELAKLHEQRLSHTFAALIAIEELLGETRARFRAKGISIIDPRHLPPRRTPSSAVIESITPGSGTERVEPHVVPTEVCIIILTQVRLLRTMDRALSNRTCVFLL